MSDSTPPESDPASAGADAPTITNSTPLAARFVRGLATKETADPEAETVLWAAFLSDKRTAAAREDGGREASIDWEDDENVLPRMLRKQRAQFGAATVELAKCAPAFEKEQVMAERKTEDENVHHGNLVYSHACTPQSERTIAGFFATVAKFHPRKKGKP